MKIIKDNFAEKTSRYTCNFCNSIIEYDDRDISCDYRGRKCIICPCCSYVHYLDEDEQNDIMRINDITYPHDYHNSANGVDITNEEINKSIKELINHLKKHPDESFRFYAVGNAFIGVFNIQNEDEYYIVISKNYYDASVSKY